MASTPPDLAPIKAQVYKDPRPAEFFDRFHDRARTREPDAMYEIVRVATSLYSWVAFRTRGIAPASAASVASSRSASLRAVTTTPSSACTGGYGAAASDAEEALCPRSRPT